MLETRLTCDPERSKASVGNFFNLRAWSQRLWRSAVFLGVFGTAMRAGANLFLLPFVLTRLPAPDLAVWWVFLALGGIANLSDFGFGPAISRVYSYLWAGAEDFDAEGLRPPPKHQEPNLPRIRQLSATVRFFYWRLSLGATLLLAIIGTILLFKPISAVTEPRWVWVAWAGYLLTIAYNLGTNWWNLACQGLGRVREMQLASTYSGLSYVTCAGALLLAGWGLPALVVASFLKGLVSREYCRRVYCATVPKVHGQRGKLDLDILKRLWPNASKLGVLSIGAFLLCNGSILISSHFLEPSITASFGLTAQIGSFVMNFAALWLNVQWPKLTMLRTQGRLQEMSILFARRLAFVFATYTSLAVLVVLAGNWLLEWKGTHTRLLPTPALIFYFVYLAQQVIYVQFGALAFTENVVPFFKVSLFTGLGMLGLSLILTWAFGLWGMLAAPLIAESACSSWFTVRRGYRGQPLTPKQFLGAALFGHP